MIFRHLLVLTISIHLALSSYAQSNTRFLRNGEEIIPLTGEWNLVMGEFLSYEEILKEKKSIKVNVPGTWNEVEWNSKTVGPFGYGTYFTTVIIDKNWKPARLALEVTEVSLAYRLFVNQEEIGRRGNPGKSLEEEIPKIDFGIFDFAHPKSDTLTIFFHISNFSHESGGLWYAPNLGYEDELRNQYELNKTIKLLILGSIIIGGLFQFYIFMRRRKEKFGLFFFFVCISLILLTVSRGDMPLLDLFPSTSWITLKRIVYISIFIIAPANALFLRELYPDYYSKIIVRATVIIACSLTLFTLIVSPRISYVIIPFHHSYNLVFGLYLFISLARAAKANKFGARFLLIGYIVGFITAIHDTLKSQYVIEGLPIEMIHIGTLVYIFQLIFVLAGRYIYALESKEKISDHLKVINDELEQKVHKRTLKLSKQNAIIEEQNAQLQDAIEEKDHLMAVVAHDLKAPFDGISSLSDLMKPNLDSNLSGFNDLIKKMTLDGRNLIENLTQMGYYETGDFEMQLENIDLKEFFHQKCVSFQKIAAEKEVTLTQSIHIQNDYFLTDKSLLDRIVDNLLSNAIKFSPKQKEVNFTFIENQNLEIRIKDNGPGFSEKDLKKAFGKFQKLSAKPTGGESSTGLGLSIVKTLTELLNGNIEIISEEGKGAEMLVTIPKASN